ncbi:MAG: class I SAM-dependent RNA methyltransferase [Hyphomicrobiales bacterium]
MKDAFEIYLVAPPGLEEAVCTEARNHNFASPKTVLGGVTFIGTWPDVWRANLELRGPSHVLARIGEFHTVHLAQLDKLSRKFPWGEFLRPEVPLRVEVTCRKSKIYHAGAAKQRIETALKEEWGATISEDAELCIKARFEYNLCTISVDASGEPLHKRGHKTSTGKAPLRENLAALFLLQCGYKGKEPVVDPMCGSGTFVIEAAEMAMGLMPGRSRGFAFEKLKSFDAAIWKALRDKSVATTPTFTFYGSDRDAGALASAKSNAARAGVATITHFHHHAITDLYPPEGPPGLVIINPPYGTRIGDKKKLHDLHAALGQTLLTRFKGWRVGLITADTSLAKATGLPFAKPFGPVNHGGLKVFLFQASLKN